MELISKMSEEKEPKKKSTLYHYIQFTATPQEKEIIQTCAEKENFKTTSDFIRRIVFNHIRKQENPELFLSNGNDSANTLLLEKISKDVKEFQKNVDVLMQREDLIDQIVEGIRDIKYMVEMNNLAKERKVIVELLEKHSSLSQQQLKEMTGFPEDVILKVIMDNGLFKVNHAGRFALR